jgi:mannose-1-phosphate guanylyltransferase
MRGIVIAGGYGTRLRPLTITRPKPLMPLVNAPLLEYQLSYLRKAGISEVCFATNYMADAVESYFGNGNSLGLSIVYAIETEPLDTGGAIRNAYDAFPGDDCVVFNGDTIHAFDIKSIIDKHLEMQADITLTLKEVQRPHAYGVVPMDENQRVLGFKEPTDEEKRNLSGPSEGTDAINAGLYIINKDILEMFPVGKSNVEREVFPKMIDSGKRVFGNLQRSYWIDIGRPSQYLEAVRAVISGDVDYAKPFEKVGDSSVEKTAKVVDAVSISQASSIGERVKVGEESVIKSSVLLEDVEIGKKAELTMCIVGERSKIGNNVKMQNVVLGADSVIPDYSVLGEIP